MTISSALNASVAGLGANAARLAAISDNIANSSTFGYKRVEVDFQSLVVSGNGGKYTAGGVLTSTQRLIDEGGGLVSTSNATDLAVRGRGFLPVALASEIEANNSSPQMLLTTTGSFRPDANGVLRTESGLVLMGIPADSEGTLPAFSRDSNSGLEPVQINTTQLIGVPTTEMSLGINLPATETVAGASGDPFNLSVEYFGNLGISENVDITFTPSVPGAGATNEWNMMLTDSASGGAVIGEYTLTFDSTQPTGGSLLSVASISGGAYNPTTGSVIVNVNGGPMEISVGEIGTSNGLTQLADNFAPLSISKNGSPVGNMVSTEVDANGFVHAIFDTGVTQVIFQVPLVDLPNPNGMMSLDQETYIPTPESGAFFLWDAGDGPTGEVAAFTREQSTTDVAGELTDMIQTQRAYSSNAKVIQTVSEMLQETTNIIR